MNESIERFRMQAEGNARRIAAPEAFFHILDLEVKRARRYQEFFSLIILKLRPISGQNNGNGCGTSYSKLVRFAAEELRESDILGGVGPNTLGALLPYAEQSDGIRILSRFRRNLPNYDFGPDEVLIKQISFPMDGTDTVSLLKRIPGDETEAGRVTDEQLSCIDIL